MIIENKKAKYDYELTESLEAGIVLSGAEVKAIRNGKVNLEQSYVKIIGNEAFLINANISTQEANTRSRKLLLHQREILNLSHKIKSKNLILIPVSLYNKPSFRSSGKNSLFKLEVALAKAKRKHEKRDKIKKRDSDRDSERELKNY